MTCSSWFKLLVLVVFWVKMEWCTTIVSFYAMCLLFCFFEVDGKVQFATPLMLGQPLMVTWFGFCILLRPFPNTLGKLCKFLLEKSYTYWYYRSWNLDLDSSEVFYTFVFEVFYKNRNKKEKLLPKKLRYLRMKIMNQLKEHTEAFYIYFSSDILIKETLE